MEQKLTFLALFEPQGIESCMFVTSDIQAIPNHQVARLHCFSALLALKCPKNDVSVRPDSLS